MDKPTLDRPTLNEILKRAIDAVGTDEYSGALKSILRPDKQAEDNHIDGHTLLARGLIANLLRQLPHDPWIQAKKIVVDVPALEDCLAKLGGPFDSPTPPQTSPENPRMTSPAANERTPDQLKERDLPRDTEITIPEGQSLFVEYQRRPLEISSGTLRIIDVGAKDYTCEWVVGKKDANQRLILGGRIVSVRKSDLHKLRTTNIS